jgi:hypothetical protein
MSRRFRAGHHPAPEGRIESKAGSNAPRVQGSSAPAVVLSRMAPA